MSYLRHWFNGQTISIFQLKDSAVIGRDPQCAIHVDDPTVSGNHARIFRGAQGYEVEDLGSTNGLVVNGERVPHCFLVDGKTFALGTHEFEFLQTLPEGLGKTMKIKKSWIPGVYFAR